MKTLLASLFIFISAYGIAQKTSLLLDVTQTSLFSPVLVYNIYSPLTDREHISFLQFGIGGQVGFYKEFISLGHFDLYNEQPYLDRITAWSNNGGMLRIGAFTGKLFNKDWSKINLAKIMYIGAGTNLKYVTNRDIKAKYEFAGDNRDANLSYRYQGEKTIIIAPFFNAGVQLFRNKVMAEWYAGIQSIIKIRNITISKEYIITNKPYSVTEKGPYHEKETCILPAFTLGFRLGGIMK